MQKALLLAVLIVIAVCTPSHAEPRQYTDEKGFTALPAQIGTNATTTGQSSNAPVNVAPSGLPPEVQEQFKDVAAASSIPPEGTSASCVEFKAGLNSDMDKIMQAIRDLAEAKKKGELGVLATMKGMWALKSVSWFAYRHITGPEQCVKEFDKENEKRFEDMTKEINALTEEVKDK